MVMRAAITTGVRRADPARLELLVPANVVLDEAEDAVLENFERTLRALAAAGEQMIASTDHVMARRILRTIVDFMKSFSPFVFETVKGAYRRRRGAFPIERGTHVPGLPV